MSEHLSQITAFEKINATVAKRIALREATS
jgi:hypothetical protein